MAEGIVGHEGLDKNRRSEEERAPTLSERSRVRSTYLALLFPVEKQADMSVQELRLIRLGE